MNPVAESTFPSGFGWGAATSAFQIEGATTSGGRGPSIWDRFCEQPGAIADGTNGEGPVRHYELWEDDIRLLQQLQMSNYRFSIAWPRVLPTGRGSVNIEGLDFYDRLVDGLLAAGIEPFPTLYHWDLPQALQDEGGWPNRETAYAFGDYAEVVVARLGDRVKNWSTLNEPFVSTDHGHVTGEHAPGHRSMSSALATAHHLMLAHGLATQRIRRTAPDVRVGCVLNFTPVLPRTNGAQDRARAVEVDDWENRWYIDVLAGRSYPPQTVETLGWAQDEVLDGDLEIIAQPLDFLGVNFYSRQIVSADPTWKADLERTTDMGWEIHPQSLGSLLRRLDEDYNFAELMITENGAAMADTARVDGRIDDQDRITYLREHLEQVASAIADGVPVTHYFVWSLLDNFEWAHGYEKTFGIVEVDPETGERRPKASAEWIAGVAARNSLADASASGGNS